MSVKWRTRLVVTVSRMCSCHVVVVMLRNQASQLYLKRRYDDATAVVAFGVVVVACLAAQCEWLVMNIIIPQTRTYMRCAVPDNSVRSSPPQKICTNGT